MNNKYIIRNATVGFGGEIIIIALGIIVPRIFIVSYGSDVNGLLTTLTQIFSYLALLEAGISQAARNALYEPIHSRSRREVSRVLSTARSYYRRISTYYFLIVIFLSFSAPLFLKTDVSYGTVSMVMLIEGLSNALSFYFVQTYNTLLRTDGKAYIISTINLIYRIASYGIRIILALNGLNIVILQVAYLLLTFIKILFYDRYISKEYSWLEFNANTKGELLPDRNSYIVTEIAWTIFSSTDLIVLSTFLSTKHASVYSVYNMIFVGINSVLNAGYHNINYVLGMKYHESIDAYEKVHDAFMSVFIGAMAILMSVTYIMILPFIKIYTHGINDINYINTELPLLFCLVQLISWSRYIQGNLTGVAGYAKETSRVSVIEAFTNIILSVLLVHKLGLKGVLFATVVALPLKVIYTTYISDKKVLKRSYYKSATIIGVNFLLFFATVGLNNIFENTISNVFDFIIWGIIYTIAVGTVGIIINIIVNPSCVKILSLLRGRRTDGAI